jgi:hypothetical protein
MKSKLKTRIKILIILEIALFALFLFVWFVNPIVSTVVLILLLYDLKRKADRIQITHEGISIYNTLSFERRFFQWTEIDQVVIYLDTLENFGKHTIFIRRGNILLCKVAGSNYENLMEMLVDIEQKQIQFKKL